MPSGEVKFKVGQLKKKTKSRTITNGVANGSDPAESDEEFERLHKQLGRSKKKVKGVIGQVKGKIAKKLSLKLKSKQNRNLKNKGLKGAQKILSKDRKGVKSIQNMHRGKKNVKKNKLKIHK